MNIAVINVKDLFKYILKFCIVFFLLLALINTIKQKERVTVTETIKANTSKINKKVFTECIDINLSLLSYKKTKNTSHQNILSNSKILAIQTGIFDKRNLKDKKINKNEEITEEIENKVEDIPKEVVMENVSENNIEPKFNCSYNGVKIDNQSDYEITEDMLIPNEELTNKKDILIYHTHTCESYTPSERILLRNDWKL